MVPKTYADAGVDIQEAVSLKERIGKLAESTFNKQVFALHDELGLFFDPTRFKRFKALFRFKGALLVSSVDGVGTKTKIAAAMNNYGSLGFDLVHHSVNDILIRGAIPLFFLDYIAMGKLAPTQVEAIVQGLAQACLEVGCALIGGETAEMPGVYYPGEVDIVGFIVGAAEEDAIIDINTIAPGDIIVALPSSGLHTNGYSLVRTVFNLDNDKSPLQRFYPELGNTLGAALLEPHRCYLGQLKPWLPKKTKEGWQNKKLKGLAHITGGGLPVNLTRTLPKGFAAHIHKASWEVPPLFRIIEKAGPVAEDEMFRTFNMGIGMAIVLSPTDANDFVASVPEAFAIGEIVEGERRVILD
ncbi:MAG: phosphoribosylformylglycinamidine cyclo-ligase [Chloroflexi bacterium RBG_13_51_36]|nr:MAG: phosphoribosylformylglycinamidine cyclo-ligase [Chloroflexi bacterium RBG_13_51_36]